MTGRVNGAPVASIRYRHREAYCLMWYACRCGHRERIWNSRDGVTPFGGILCTSCGGGSRVDNPGLAHDDFHLDECVHNHRLVVGQRFFRDGTAEDALAIIEQRIVKFAAAGRPIPVPIQIALREDARHQRGEWLAGWPMIGRHVGPEVGGPPKAELTVGAGS